MLLHGLRLTNFGPYKGDHHIAFSTAVDQPITLIGGQNGAGKTTIIEALLLSIYGIRARKRIGFDNYTHFLSSLVHHGQEFAQVSLEFSDDNSGVERHYSVSRAWNSDGNYRRKGGLSVQIDGETVDSFADEKMWSEHMDQIVPLSIAGLVIFDGEKIEQLAAPDASAEALRDYVEGLLGLDLIERLGSDLTTFKSRVANTAALETNSVLLEELQQVQSQVDECKKLCADWSERCFEAGVHHEDCAHALRVVEDRFAAHGGELYQQREQLVARVATLRAELDSVTNQAHLMAVGAAPLLLVRSLLEVVSSVGEATQETEEQQMLLTSHKERDDRIVEQFMQLAEADGLHEVLDSVGGTSAAVDNEQLQMFSAVLRNLLADDRQAYERSYEPPFAVSPESTRRAADLSSVGGEELSVEVTKCLETLRTKQNELGDIKLLLDSIPEESSIQQLLKELASATVAHDKAEEEVLTVQDELDEHERNLARVQNRFEVLANQVLESDSATREQSRIAREVGKAQQVLERFKEKVTAQNIENIRFNILESLQDLYRKERLVSDVEINPRTYEVILHDSQGNRVSQSRLSAGERQLLATGQLWGLSKSTNRQLPTVIDTPVGRLDSSHRSHLVERYFPNAGRQVVLLSTDEEIVGSYHQQLSDVVGRSYLLEYSPESNSSTISEGYFR